MSSLPQPPPKKAMGRVKGSKNKPGHSAGGKRPGAGRRKGGTTNDGKVECPFPGCSKQRFPPKGPDLRSHILTSHAPSLDDAFNQIVESILAANSIDPTVFKSTVDGLPLPIDHPLSEDNPKSIAARRRREEKLKAKQLENAQGGGGAGPSGLSEDGQMVDQDGRSVDGGASHSMDDGHPSAADLATSTSLDGGPQSTEFGQVAGVGGGGADVDHQFIAESAYTHGHDLTEEDYHHVHHPHELQHDDPHGHLHPHQDHHHQVIAHPHEFDEGGHHLAHEEPLGEFTHLDHHHQLHHHQLHHQLQHEDESHEDGLVGATNGGASGGGTTSELDGNIIAQVMASYNAGSTSAGSSAGLAGGPDSLSANILRALGRGPSSNLVGGGGPTSGQSTSAGTAPAGGVGGLDPTIDPSLDAAGSEPTSTSAFGGTAGLTGGPPPAGGRLGSLDAGPSREGGGPVRTMRPSSGPARRKNPGGGGTPYGRPPMTVGSTSTTALADGRGLREGSMSSTGAGGGGGQRGPRKCRRCVPLDPDGAAACPGRFVRANCDLNKRIEEGRSAVSLSAAADAAGGAGGGGGGWEDGEEGGMFNVSHPDVDEVDLVDVNDGSSVAGGGAGPSTSTHPVGGSPLTPGGSHAAGSINTANGRSSTPSGGGLQQHPNLLAPLPPVSGLPERKPRHCKVCVFHGREGRDCPGRGDRRKCASFKEGEDREGLYGRAVRRSVGGGGQQQGGPSSSGGFDEEDQDGLPSAMDQPQPGNASPNRTRQQHQLQDVDSGLPPLQVGEPAGVEDEMDYVGGPSAAVGGGVGGQEVEVEDGMLEMVDPGQYVADGEDMAE